MTHEQIVYLSERIAAEILKAVDVGGESRVLRSMNTEQREVLAAAICAGAFKGLKFGLDYRRQPN